jgi:predicted dehydrogenase
MIDVAVVGAGNWGKNLVRTFASLTSAKLRFVCDLDDKIRKNMSVMYPDARIVDELKEILADAKVQAVVIAVDAPLHYKVTKMVLLSGKHAYVEKPLTLSSAESHELVEIARKQNVKLMVGHLLEYHPAVNYLKDQIVQNTLGQPLYLYSQRVNLGIVRKTENAWWSLAPHDISLACYLFDAEPVSVSASGQAYLQKGIEDVVFANLKFADGRMAHIHVSWLDPHKIRRITLVGSQKMAVFDDMNSSEPVRIYDKGTDVQRSVNSYAEAVTLRTGDILIPKISSEEPLKSECQHFLTCIEKNQTPRSDGLDGLRVVKVLEAGSRSLSRGGDPVDI